MTDFVETSQASDPLIEALEQYEQAVLAAAAAVQKFQTIKTALAASGEPLLPGQRALMAGYEVFSYITPPTLMHEIRRPNQMIYGESLEVYLRRIRYHA